MAVPKQTVFSCRRLDKLTTNTHGNKIHLTRRLQSYLIRLNYFPHNCRFKTYWDGDFLLEDMYVIQSLSQNNAASRATLVHILDGLQPRINHCEIYSKYRRRIKGHAIQRLSRQTKCPTIWKATWVVSIVRGIVRRHLRIFCEAFSTVIDDLTHIPPSRTNQPSVVYALCSRRHGNRVGLRHGPFDPNDFKLKGGNRRRNVSWGFMSTWHIHRQGLSLATRNWFLNQRRLSVRSNALGRGPADASPIVLNPTCEDGTQAYCEYSNAYAIRRRRIMAIRLSASRLSKIHTERQLLFWIFARAHGKEAPSR